MIALLLTTDGRRACIEQTIPSLLKHVSGFDGPRLIFDDSGDESYRRWLAERFDGFDVIGAGPRLGQGHSLRRAWTYLADYLNSDWVFHCEDDFVFERYIDLRDLVKVLRERDYLQQMALIRQPWFPGEVAAGGIVERDPDAYEAVSAGESAWLEHRLWFTLNPCLYRRELCKRERPVGRRHEWRFSRELCEDPTVRFGLWGDGEPWIRHIGGYRAGEGY